MSHMHKILTEEDESLIPSINSHRIDSHQTLQNSNYESQSATQICERKPVQSPENMIGLITHQIQDEIQKSQITISNEPKPFPLIDSSSASSIVKNEPQKYDVNKVAEFVKKRQHLQQEIRRLKLQQEEQRNKSRSQSPLDKTYKNFRSNFTTEEHLQISRIIRKSQKFQNQIQNKEKILAQTLEAENLRQQEEQKLYLKKLKEKKKQEALKKIWKIEQQKMQRIQKIKLQNKIFQSVKNTKALHQKIQEHDKLFEEQKKEKQVQMLKQKRQSMTVNFAQIKNHEKKYYETVRMSKEKIQHQVLQKIQKMKEQQVLLSQTYRPSKFLLNLWNEEKQKEELQIERIQKLKSLYNRKNNYQEELRIIHKEKIKTKPKVDMKKSTIDNKIQEHQLKVKSMSAADIYRQGQEYMKSVHKSITPNLVEQTKSELQRNYSELKNAPKPQYRDYLQEQKLKKELQYKSTGNLKIRENPQIHELEGLIERKKENKMIKLEKAKIIAQKLDKKAKNSTTSALIDSISAKLKIIEEFS